MDTVSVQQIELFTPTTAAKLIKEIAARVMSEELSAKVIELEGEGYYREMLDRLLTISEFVTQYFGERYWVGKLTDPSRDKVDARARGLITGYYLLVEFIEHSINSCDISSQNEYVDQKGIDYNALIWIMVFPSYKSNHDKTLSVLIGDIKALHDQLYTVYPIESLWAFYFF